jgi:subtilisin family serine protease
MEHIVLRELTGRYKEGPQRFRIPTSLEARGNQFDADQHQHLEPQLEVRSLDRLDDVRDVSDEPDVVAVAPAMPVALIQPVGSGESDGEEPWGIAAIGADQCGFTGAGVCVAVLDTGIDSSHPAFVGAQPVEQDFTGEGNGDRNGHGTHCAGTIFGREVDGFRIGVAPGVTRPLIGKVLDSNGGGDTGMLFRAITWAVVNGAQIISMSLGFDFPGMVKRDTERGLPAEMAASRALQAYRDNLRLFDDLMRLIVSAQMLGSGTLVFAATGNESRVDKDPSFRIGPSLPAAARGVISVGALARTGPGGRLGVAPFSNGLPSLAAPGVDIVSAARGGGLASLSGTSMACPHAAGAAALWWQWARENKPGQPPTGVVERSLLGGAQTDNLEEAATAAVRGAGLVQVPL